ncbi:hypothetical protein MUK42_11265 [Musa troglodytarum]|uniref:Uncharacterized protein n=1 Tax=Musa troglodytarum TaxID=320322 RepID=A0A9E7KGU4_9LILI|nr:hypothetical protein MUK42_11265 [Musa troglodytarum]
MFCLISFVRFPLSRFGFSLISSLQNRLSFVGFGGYWHCLGAIGIGWWDIWNGSACGVCGMRSLTAAEFEIHPSDSRRKRRRRRRRLERF